MQKKNIGDCELMSIFINKKYNGLGFGTLLEKAFCLEAKNRGAKIVELTTDKKNNENVNKFYIKNGYILIQNYITKENREMNKYIKYL